MLFNVQWLTALSSNEEFLNDGRRAEDRLLTSLRAEPAPLSKPVEELVEEHF